MPPFVRENPLYSTRPEREALRRAGHRKCAKCGKVISLRALACRRCGKRQRVSPRTMMLGLGCAVMVGMFAVAVMSGQMSSGRASELSLGVGSAAAPDAAGAPGTPVRITAAGLLSAYQHDPTGADRIYKQKRVAVTGEVTAVPTRDFRGNVMLRLGMPDVLESVRATLAGSSSSVAVMVGKGQTISMVCTGEGALIGSPILRDCVL
jgi:hypothetical protein